MGYNLKAVKGSNTHYKSTDAFIGEGVPAEAAFDVLMGYAYSRVKDGYAVTIYADEAYEDTLPEPKKVHLGYTLNELSEAFDSVKSDKGWKFPINAIIDIDEKLGDIEHSKLISAAIGFYAGGGAEIILLNNHSQLKVTAPGYYEMIGA